MPKSNIEKQLEKLQKENKRQQADDKKQAIKAEIRERASSIVNGQPIIKGLRIMDETSEILLQALLKIYKEKDSCHINFSYDVLPECVQSYIGLEFEKLTQYGMTNSAMLWMGGGIIDLLPPALSYFERKEKINIEETSSDIKKDCEMVFISHRSADKNIADAFADFLKAIGIPSNKIFCSSLPGNDVKRKIDIEVKQNLLHSKVNIVILSSEYFKSAYCLNEEGIIWYEDKPQIIIALPEIDENNLIGFIDSTYKLWRLNSSSDVASIYDIIKPLYALENNIASLNREIDKLVKNYDAELAQRVKKDNTSTKTPDDNLTDDEASILYYLWKNKKRKINSPELIKDWLRDNEIYDIDVPNGLDLLSATNNGKLQEDSSFELDINYFRNLSSKNREEVKYLIDKIMPHYKPSKQSFISMWGGKSCTDLIKLFVAYIKDENMVSFGDRWLAEMQIKDIQQWEQKYSLSSDLSSNYGSALQYFIEEKYVYPSSYTSHGNPREYTMHKSLKDFIFSEDFSYMDDLKLVKDNYKCELPF